MGRKAVSALLHILVIVLSLLLLVAAALCWRASYVSPEQGEIWSTLALLMPVVLTANVAILVWWVVHRRWLLTLLPLVALLINLNYISAMVQLPDFGYGEETHDIRIVTLNAHTFDWGESRPVVVNTIAELMGREQVDVLCLQEFSAFPGYSAETIASYFAFRMPYFVFDGSAAILSRFPILDHKYVRFPDTYNDYMRADLLVGQDTVRVVAVHLQTSGISTLQRQYQRNSGEEVPVDMMFNVLGHNTRIRAQQVRDIRALIDSSPYPVILVGDFNDTPSAFTYRTMKGGMTDGFQAAGSGYGGTFRGMGGLLRIDYIFYDDAFEGIRYRILDERLSDHKAIVADLRIKR